MTPWTEFSRPEYWSGYPIPSQGNLPNPRIEPGSPVLQADSLSSESPGKPKNTGVGSRSLLQGIFPTQELNQGPLNCRRILYQLSYQERPREMMDVFTYLIVVIIVQNRLNSSCCKMHIGLFVKYTTIKPKKEKIYY